MANLFNALTDFGLKKVLGEEKAGVVGGAIEKGYNLMKAASKPETPPTDGPKIDPTYGFAIPEGVVGGTSLSTEQPKTQEQQIAGEVYQGFTAPKQNKPYSMEQLLQTFVGSKYFNANDYIKKTYLSANLPFKTPQEIIGAKPQPITGRPDLLFNMELFSTKTKLQKEAEVQFNMLPHKDKEVVIGQTIDDIIKRQEEEREKGYAESFVKEQKTWVDNAIEGGTFGLVQKNIKRWEDLSQQDKEDYISKKDNQDQEKQKKIFEEWMSGAVIAGGVEANKYFPGSPVRKYRGTKEGEAEEMTKEALIDIPGSFIRGAVGSMTLGAPEVFGQGEVQRQAPIYEQNKELASTIGFLKSVSGAAGVFSGGFVTYGAISRQISKGLPMIGGKTGAFLSKHPVLTAYTVQNIGEELVERTIRKTTGQQYGWGDFALGIAMGAGFESLMRFPEIKGVIQAWGENKATVLQTIDETLKQAEIDNGMKQLTPQEVQNIILGTKINNEYSVGNLYRATNFAYKTGLAGSFGEKGMTSLKGKNMKPSVTDIGVRISDELPKIDTKKIGDDLNKEAEEFLSMKRGEKIVAPEKEIEMELKLPNELQSKTVITRKTLKHIVERQKDLAPVIIKDIPEILQTPTKIADNSVKRANSYLFAKMNGKAKATVLEVVEVDGKNKVVSAFYMDKKTYSKMIDISGRSDVPPSSSEGSILSTLRKTSFNKSIRGKNEFVNKTGANELPDAGRISEEARIRNEIENDRLPWETEEEWKDRVGEEGTKSVKTQEFIEREKPSLEGKKYLEYQADKMINEYIDEVLKKTMGQGVEKGSLVRDERTLDVVGRIGSVSNNEKWFQEFYKKFNRGPSAIELREIAIDHLENGYRGIEYDFEPNKEFRAIKGMMEEMGVKIPLKKLPKAIKGGKKALTIEKELVRGMAKKRATLAELGMQDAKGEKLRLLKQEYAKRLGIEKKIRAGEFEVVSAEDLSKIRKSGGIGMAALNLLDKGVGKITSGAVGITGKGLKAVGEFVDKATELPKLITWKTNAKNWLAKWTPQAGLDKNVYEAFEGYRKAQNREFRGITEMLQPLIKMTKDEGMSEKAFRYLGGEKVELPKEVESVLNPIRDEIDIEGLRQVMIGNLPKETFYANMGKYMRRLYASHQLEGFSPLAESYNNLKNVFISKGFTGEEAEEAITGIVTKNIKDKYKGVLPKSIKTGGDFRKGRKLGDDEMSKAIRDFLGEVQDPDYIIGRTLFDLKRSRLNAELLAELGTTSAVKDKIPSGEATAYRKLEGKEWGVLDGKYMDKKVFKYMEEMKGTDQQLGKTLTKLNNFIKANLTVRNPAGQFRNLTSNFSTSQAILGHNYLSASGMKELYEAVLSLKNKDGFYKELMAYGRLGDTGITRDLGDRLEEVFKDTDLNSRQGVMTAIKKVDKFLGKSYEAGDNLFLMANYKKLRAKGLEPILAIKEASRVTPDYGEIGPMISKLRKSIVGLPFVTWRYKVYPEIIKSIIKRPIGGTMPIWFPWAAGNLIASQLDMSEAEKEVFKTKLYRDGKLPIGRDEKGDIMYFDYGTYTPFADMFKGRFTPESSPLGFMPEQLEGYVSGSIPGIGAFPVQLLLDISQNYDPFTGREITYADAWSPEWGWDMATHVAPQLLPIVGTSVKNINKMVKGEMGLGEGILRSALGLKVESGSIGKFEKEESYSRPGFSMNKDRMDIYDTVKEIAKTASDNPEEANAALKELAEKYPEQKDYIKDRARYEKNKVTGKSTTQSTIRQEVLSIADLAKKDKALANQRVKELVEKYPEEKDYILKKAKEAKEQMS